MRETQRQPVPRVDDSELATGLAFLRFARECVLKKLDGLADDDLRRDLVPSGTNLLGRVRHLAVSERYWFHHHVAGEPLTAPQDHTFFSMDVEPGRSVEDVVADYRTAAAHSDELVTAIGDPDALTAELVDGETTSAAVGARPHDDRDHPARGSRRHPARAARRHHRPLTPGHSDEFGETPVDCVTPAARGHVPATSRRLDGTCTKSRSI